MMDSLYRNLLKQELLHDNKESERRESFEVDIHVHYNGSNISAKVSGKPIGLIAGAAAALDTALDTIDEIKDEEWRRTIKKACIGEVFRVLSDSIAEEED